MKIIRYGLIVLWLLVCSVTSSNAQVSIGIGLPNVSIGVNLPLFPQLVRVPGYPVYYAPRVDANYFFYDGMYWVYHDDNWYASSWYNGPWGLVQREAVPLFILRIPVSYYRQPPAHFRGWQSNAPPRWGEHWGHEWEQRRNGWDKWKRGSAPAPAPLPVYQRKYAGDKYPKLEQQQPLRSNNYRYQPRDTVVRQHIKQQADQKAPVPASVQKGKKEDAPMRSPKQQDPQISKPHQQGAPADPHSQPPQRGGEFAHKTPPLQTPVPQRVPVAHDQKQQPVPQHEQQAPRVREQEQRQQERGESQESNRGRGQGQNRDEERGRGRDK
jgi:hypothetical protein